MEIKLKLNHNLIYCEVCLGVIDKSLCSYQSEQDRDGHQYSAKELTELLTKTKWKYYSRYNDIEQTSESYLKYCFICKDVKRFSVVEFEED